MTQDQRRHEDNMIFLGLDKIETRTIFLILKPLTEY